MNSILNLDSFHDHILKMYPQEAAGVIAEGIFVPVENVHSDPVNFFSFPESWSLALCNHDYKVVHSHTMESFTDDPRIPSYEDMVGQRNSGKEWGIVHCDGEKVTDVLWFGKPNLMPLEGRKYIPNVQDCFTLARDFLFQTHGIDIGSHPRPKDWEEWNPHYIEQNFASLGFIEVRELQENDIVLFAIGSRYINHIGIYLGDDTFIHHLYNRISAKDSFSKWNRQFIKAIRFIK